MNNSKKQFENSDARKRFYIKTFGCQMNVCDSGAMRGILTEMGYSEVDSFGQADIIILDTCSVRESAEHKVFTLLGDIRKKVQSSSPAGVPGGTKFIVHSKRIVILAGCMVNMYEETLSKTFPSVDIFVGTRDIGRTGELVREYLQKGELALENNKIFAVSEETPPDIEKCLAAKAGGISADIVIMRGCDNYCSYCVVPYARGRELSRPPEEILRETEKAAENGARQITLLGQNVNSYKSGGTNFAALLKKVEKARGIERIWFMTNHPKDFSDELIEAMASSDKIGKYIHMPFQSGSDRILELMGRRYTADEYAALAEKIKKRIPGITISADIIVGFPSETEEDFRKTVELVEKVGFIKCYSFKYSPRKKTAAYRLKDDVPDGVKVKRLAVLNEVILKTNRAVRDSFIGRKCSVFAETVKDGFGFGKTENGVYVSFNSSSAPGSISKAAIMPGYKYAVRIISNNPRFLIGQLV